MQNIEHILSEEESIVVSAVAYFQANGINKVLDAAKIPMW